MLHHIYPAKSPSDGISVYGRRIDALLGKVKLDQDVWHFELGYIGSDELWAADRARRSGGSYVLTLHDPPVVCGKPFSSFIRSSSWPAKVARKMLDLTIGKLIIDRVVKGASRVIVLNPMAKPSVVRKFDLSEDKVEVLPLIPSLEQPKYKPTKPGARVRFLFLGILTPRKGVEDLIKAFALLKTDGVHLTIFGGPLPDNASYPEQLQSLAEKLGVKDDVLFTGYGDDEAMSKALLDTDVVVLPYQDAGIVHASGPLVTAMAFGRAVIASKIPIFSGTIHDEKTGILVPTGDADLLAKAMDSLAANSNEITKLGTAAYSYIRDEHNPSIIKQHLLEVYHSA